MDGRSGGRSVYGRVITKFSQMGSLPHFLTHGAPLPAARASRARAPVKTIKVTVIIITITIIIIIIIIIIMIIIIIIIIINVAHGLHRRRDRASPSGDHWGRAK